MRRRLMGPPVRLGRLAIAAQAVLAILLVAFLLVQDGVRFPLASDGDWHLEVALRDAGGLSPSQHAAVMVAGVPAGRVEQVREERGAAGGRARPAGGAPRAGGAPAP